MAISLISRERVRAIPEERRKSRRQFLSEAATVSAVFLTAPVWAPTVGDILVMLTGGQTSVNEPTPRPVDVAVNPITQGDCPVPPPKLLEYRGGDGDLPPIDLRDNIPVKSFKEAAPSGNGPNQCREIVFEEDATVFADPGLRTPIGSLQKGDRVTATGWVDLWNGTPYRFRVIVSDGGNVGEAYVVDRATIHPVLPAPKIYQRLGSERTD